MQDYIYLSDTNEEVTWAFKELFTKKRKELNLSVRELGAKAGVSYTVIYDFEQRSVLPKIDTLIKLANALNFYVCIKRYQEELYLAICKSKDSIKRVPLPQARSPRVSVDEQLSKLLSQKGLETKEIEEIKDFIAYKLSKHKK